MNKYAETKMTKRLDIEEMNKYTIILVDKQYSQTCP